MSIFHAIAAPGADGAIHEWVSGAGAFFSHRSGFNLQREISRCFNLKLAPDDQGQQPPRRAAGRDSSTSDLADINTAGRRYSLPN